VVIGPAAVVQLDLDSLVNLNFLAKCLETMLLLAPESSSTVASLILTLPKLVHTPAISKGTTHSILGLGTFFVADMSVRFLNDLNTYDSSMLGTDGFRLKLDKGFGT